MADQLALYAAQYSSTSSALADLDAVERLHQGKLVGSFDAAVIDKENGKPHIVKRMDRPVARIIPEVFGAGRLPRKELKDAANELTSNQAGLIAVGEPTVVKGIDSALAGAVKVAKHSIDASTDEIAGELQEALKG
jgi:predicted nucleic acid-binding Zn ribbon protein